MKKTFKTMLALMAGAMTFTGCTSDILENTPEQIPSALKPMTFTAIQEGDATRAAIDASDGVSINWTAGDKISIFDGATENCGNQAFTLDGEGGSPSGTFDGEADPDASTYYALYPYVESKSDSKTVTEEEAKAAAGDMGSSLEMWKEDWEIFSSHLDMIEMEMKEWGISSENQAIIFAYLKGEKIETKVGPQRNESNQFENVVLPAEQTATVGSADPKAMLMIAKSDDKSTLKFKNVCAYVKVKPQFDCSVITITSNGEENLAGTVTVDYNEGNPTTTVTANGSNSVYLMGSITAGKTYYIAVRPETLKNGFFVDFLTNDKTHYYQRSTSNNNFTFVRSNVLNLGEFDTNSTWTYNGVTSGNDGEGHDWVLVAPNVRLATTPIGVKIKGVEVDNHLSDWGTKWVVPLSTDLRGKLICTWNNNEATISGKGALRELPIVMSVYTYYTWCRDLYPYPGVESHYMLSLTDGHIVISDDNADWAKHDIIYQYVGE